MQRQSRLIAILIAALVTTPVIADQSTDQDQDGVPDSEDRCPDTPFLKKHKIQSRYKALFTKEELSGKKQSVPVDKYGCTRDSDNDGVADYLDYCPDNTSLEISKGVSHNGCARQSDGDGTPDYRDKCPGTEKGIKTDRFGCPI